MYQVGYLPVPSRTQMNKTRKKRIKKTRNHFSRWHLLLQRLLVTCGDKIFLRSFLEIILLQKTHHNRNRFTDK